ncbi:MAG: GlsB/YeaQ/YmgE family stress response membrane protein [Myxococcota bacterium]
MEIAWTIISYSVFGLFAGLIARFLVPGRDPMGLFGTILLGIAGSFAGGFAWNLFVTGNDDLLAFEPANFGGSILGAIALLVLIRLFGLRGDGKD